MTDVFLTTGTVAITGRTQFAYTKRENVSVNNGSLNILTATLTTMALTVDNVGLHVDGVSADAGLTVSGELALAKVVDDPISPTQTYTAFHMGNVRGSGG